MNKYNITALAAAITLAFGTAAIASPMSKTDYKASKKTIEAEYKSAKAGCDAFKANANDICEAEAKGKEQVALAELENSYQPSQKNRYDVRIAKAHGARILLRSGPGEGSEFTLLFPPPTT